MENSLGRDALLESIVRPDAKVAPQWVTWTIITTDGKTYSGLVAEEKADSLTLVEASGKRTTLGKKQIEDKEPNDLSVMPQRLVGNLSRQELADLLLYLVEH
jgi:putative heme-binding domain-containing protein